MISLSNFIKQRYVINLESEKVIINSDDKYMASSGMRMDSIAFPTVEVMTEASEVSDGFQAGLNAEEVYITPQPDPEEILEEARQEAERILEEARANAKQIKNDAASQAERLYEQKRQEGYNLGVTQMRQELEAEKNKLRAEQQILKNNIQKEYENKLDSLETDLVDIMIQVFHKVFHIQFDNKKQILLHLIKDTLMGIDSGKVFHIRVAESNFKFIESHITEIKEKIGNDVSIDVINDMLLEDSACMIETENGVFNCGIDMVLDNLEKDIRSLSR